MAAPLARSVSTVNAAMPASTAAAALEVSNLVVTIPTSAGPVVPADGVSFTLDQGEVLGIVGETGSGKTVTCRAMLGLLPTANSAHTGTVAYPAAGVDDVLSAGRSDLRRLRGSYVSMIPQNPMTSLNPIRRIGAQIAEAVDAHEKLSKSARRDRVVELMTEVGIPAPAKRLRDYPHQFSGGMLQRTLIAIALAGRPKLLIADEPTTALDVIIQDQILSLLARLCRDNGLSLVLVSHDLSVVAQVCDRVAVMYAGQVVETAGVDQVLRAPRHPYAGALLNSLPGAVPRDVPLAVISGSPPQLIGLGDGCRFAPRCTFAEDACHTWTSELLDVGRAEQTEKFDQDEHRARCIRHKELELAPGSSAGRISSQKETS